MLGHLRVQNLGILGDASIDPSQGLTVITGETGAGKTLLLGGLRLVLGGPADTGGVGPYGDAAQVDGLFVHDGVEIGASRIVPRGGRSRGYIDGAIASAAALADTLGTYVEIVGQHDQIGLTRPARLLELVDSAVGPSKARAAYDEAWLSLQDALERQRLIGGDQLELARELDLTRHQATEIEAARLSPELGEQLEVAASRLRNAEEIGEHLGETIELAERLAEAAGEAVARLRKAAGLDPSLTEVATEAEGLAATVAELGRSVRAAGDGLESDPARLDEVEERLTAIGDLKRKYGKTIEEVVAFGDAARVRADELERLLEEADEIDSVVAGARSRVAEAARALSGERSKAAETVAARMLEHLADLGLERAVVEIGMEPVDPGPSGADRVSFAFASDSRLEPGPVASVASGGELSRLVLSMRLATADADAATLVFDEVDTGIGGKTALAMGEKLAALAERSQVLCVTHLPQVAAHADTHYVVERGDDGVATARAVSGEDRLVELSRMLAGQPESETGKKAAAELLALAGK